MPIELSASSFTWCNRPRYYWITWPVADSRVVDDVKIKVDLVAGRMPLDSWCSRTALPVMQLEANFATFVRCVARKTPTFKPTGWDRTDEAARERWAADAWRYPVYQYAEKNVMLESKGTAMPLRPLNAAEREVIMGFPLGHTNACWKKDARKAGGPPFRTLGPRLSGTPSTFTVWLGSSPISWSS